MEIGELPLQFLKRSQLINAAFKTRSENVTEDDWTESSRKWFSSGWLNRSIKFSGYVCAQSYRWGGDFSELHLFHLLLLLTAPQFTAGADFFT